MKRILAFAGRNVKEIIRDPLSIAFGIGMPIMMIALFSLIGRKAPVDMFNVDNLMPGMAVFSFSFISLFGGMLVAKDRTSSFVIRLYSSPLRSGELIMGYAFPLIPLTLIQAIACILFSMIFGLTISANIILMLIVSIPIACVYIAFGLLFGALFNEKQVGGIFSLFVNLSAFMSGVWFDFRMVGEAFETICYILPFAHAVDTARYAFKGELTSILPHLLVTILYATIVFIIAIATLQRKKNM